MNGLAISASQKLIANRKQWGLQTLHSLNQLLLSSYKKDIYIYIYICYCLVIIAGKRNAFLRRASTNFSTLSIKEFQNLRSLDK